jgi:hypothetical protein
MKSHRVGRAWAEKRKKIATEVLTRKLPGWVRMDDDGRPDLIPERAAIVRRVFTMARHEGTKLIAQRLNAERVPVLARKTFKGRPVAWSQATVYGVLTSRAATGEFQPHVGRGGDRQPCGDVIPNYFPRVVSDDEFHAIQGILKTRAVCGRGRRGKHVNLFAGLLIDATNGGSLGYRHTSNRAPVLTPIGVTKGDGWRWTCFLAGPFEQAVLSKLAEVKLKDIQGDDDADRRAEALAGRVAEVDALVKAWAANMDNPATVDLVAAKLAALNAKRGKLAEQLADAQREAASPAAEAWGTFPSLADVVAKNPSDDVRLKVRAALRRCIESVHCVFATAGHVQLAAVQVRFRGSDRHRDCVVSYNHRGRRRANGRAWEVVSAAWDAEAGELDLRRRRDAAKVLRLLKSLDPA